jgi:hypothetical protein
MQPKIVNEHYHNASFQEIEDIQAQYVQGKVTFAVDKKLAVVVANSKSMPGNYRAAMKFWFFVQMACMIGAIIAFFVVHWIAGVGLFLTGLVIRSANNKSAGQNVIEVAKENRVFLKYALAIGLIEVRK